MTLIFKKVKLVNFGSYLTEEIDLSNQGFCLISGENHYKKDNAKSNGSGKSTIFSAICYALTGETISGVKSNLKNINTDAQDCSVTLDFSVDGDDYTLTRQHKPKNDLKIIRNGVDESGKGITESSQRLQELLPNVTKDLIASTIILGQGNVNKFSDNSPVKRKELLEHLTQSEYQIEDIKIRLENRLAAIIKQINSYNAAEIVATTSINSLTERKKKLLEEEANQVKPNFEAIITSCDNAIKGATDQIQDYQAKIDAANTELDTANKDYLKEADKKSKLIEELTTTYNNEAMELQTNRTKVGLEMSALKEEIAKLKKITDVCPTCGQKLPNVIKPDTSEQENTLTKLNEDYSSYSMQLTAKDAARRQQQAKIEQDFATNISSVSNQILQLKNKITSLSSAIQTSNNFIMQQQTAKTRCIFERDNYDKQQADRRNAIEEAEKALEEYQKQLIEIKAKQAEVIQHADVLKKIESIVKRDFRGYLLEDVIKYLNNRAKDYCEVVFGTRDLSLEVDGNNLSISYCGKNFDNLSGGEKQRCDIILQLAIRELLQNYLGYNSNIIVLDEIFDALDSIATENIIKLISSALTSVESVFVISHHATELGLNYDVKLQIIKDQDGISTIYR